MSGVANEIMYFWNGDTTASKITRHALRVFMLKHPCDVSMDFGIINGALAILSENNIYVCTRLDRFVGTMSDIHDIFL